MVSMAGISDLTLSRCCAQAWVSEQGRVDLQYIADRIRTPGEVNGKSANLNNALNHIFPPGTSIGFNEVLLERIAVPALHVTLPWQQQAMPPADTSLSEPSSTKTCSSLAMV
jgi:hypothetical protein